MDFAKRQKTIVDFIFVLALFAILIVSALFLVIFGTNIYTGITDDMETNFNARTSVNYLSAKIDSFNGRNQIEISEYNGNAMLCLNFEEISDTKYVTYIYVDSGYLREMTSPKDLKFDYSTGNKIVEVESFNIEDIDDNLLKLEIVNKNGEISTLYKNIIAGEK